MVVTVISILGSILIFVGVMTENMDAKYCRQKSELCLRLADGLSLNNPGRFQLMELAEDFLKRAKQLEAQEAEQQKSKSHKTR